MSTHAYLTFPGHALAIYLPSGGTPDMALPRLNTVLERIEPARSFVGWSPNAVIGEIIPTLTELDKEHALQMAGTCTGAAEESLRQAYLREADDRTRPRGRYHVCSHVRAFNAVYEIDTRLHLIHIFTPRPDVPWGQPFRADGYGAGFVHRASTRLFGATELYFDRQDEEFRPTALGRTLMAYQGHEARRQVRAQLQPLDPDPLTPLPALESLS